MKYAIGVDLSCTTAKIAIFTEDAQVVSKWEITTRTQENGKYILSDIASSVLEYLDKESIYQKDIVGLGIGIPAAIDPTGLIRSCTSLGWENIMVKEELEKLLGFPVYPANDANVAALGEMWKGAAEGCKDAVLVTLGTGIGCGTVIDGSILIGKSGHAGEIGHMRIKTDETDVCSCGKTGCLEQYVTETGVLRVAERILAKTTKNSTLQNRTDLTAKIIFDEARNGDPVALDIIDEVCDILACALSYVGSISDPKLIVLNGSVSDAGDQILVDNIAKYYINNVWGSLKKAKIVLAALGSDAVIFGAAKLVFDN